MQNKKKKIQMKKWKNKKMKLKILQIKINKLQKKIQLKKILQEKMLLLMKLQKKTIKFNKQIYKNKNLKRLFKLMIYKKNYLNKDILLKIKSKKIWQELNK